MHGRACVGAGGRGYRRAPQRKTHGRARCVYAPPPGEKRKRPPLNNSGGRCERVPLTIPVRGMPLPPALPGERQHKYAQYARA